MVVPRFPARVSFTFQIQLNIPDKNEKMINTFSLYTQPGVKQLTDFLRTVTAASDLVDCTFVNCDNRGAHLHYLSVRNYRKLTGIHLIRPYFFNTWFTDFFSQNIKVGGGKKIKIKITKKIFFI